MFITETATLDTFAQQLITAGMVVATVILDRLIAWLRTKKAISKAKVTLDTMQKEVSEIRSELTINGGGSVKDVVVNTNKIAYEQGKIIESIQKSINLITSQNKARFREGINILQDPTAITDEKGQWTYVNTKMQDLLGLANESTLKYGWLRPIKDPVKKEEIREGWLYSVTNLISFSANIPITNSRNGENYNIELTADPVLDDNGNVLWFYVKAKKV